MAVKKPAELDFSGKKFMAIISGQPGLGKTTLALSAPNPFLFDTDNGIARVRAEHRSVTSSVSGYAELLDDMESSEYKDCETAVIDTGGTLVQLMKDWAKKQDAKAAKDGRAMFGVIKTEFDRMCWHIRNVDKKHLVVVFHTTEVQKGDSIQTRLACEGSTKDIVWTPADFGGHMFMMGNRRMVGFTPTDEYFAKGCFGVSGVMAVDELKPGASNDFLSRVFAMAQKSIDDEAAVYGVDHKAYLEAMEQGVAAIDGIVDADSAMVATEAIRSVAHALTSEAELRGKLRDKLKAASLKWDAKEKRYAVLDDAEPAV